MPTYNCTECKTPYKGKVTVRWPVNAAKMATVCIDCLDELHRTEKEVPPLGAGVRAFVAWYRDHRMVVAPTTVIRQQKDRIAELELLVKEQAALLEQVGRQRRSTGGA